jgi:tetratricopeptide (TPR) repeat protein
MSADRIAQLHEQASEHYLNGNYDGALQAWRDVLALDPGNEQAMDGVRMASQFAPPQEAPAAVSDDLSSELDQGLRVFDSLGATAVDRKPAPSPATATAVTPDPIRQAEGIDFGDLSGIGAIPLGATDSPAVESQEAPETPAEGAEEESFGLAPLSAAPQDSPSAAAYELHRRVADLLAEAKAKADAGEKDEALAILSRLAILDDENQEAAALRERLLASGPSDLDRIEESIIEGVAALESDRLEDAERHFRAVLALSPEHREAVHYLEKVQERRAGARSAVHGGEDLLGGDLLGEMPAASAAPEAAAVPLAAPAPAKRSARSAAPTDAPVQLRVQGRGPSLKLILGGAMLAIAAVGAFMAAPMFLGGSKAPSAVVPPPPRPAPAAKPAAAAPAPIMSTEDKAKAVAASLERGRERMADGDFGAAVVAFNEALRLDPANLEAKQGLNTAGDRYKERKAEQDALESIRLAFRDGEYTSALRLAYRLPSSVPESYVTGIKAAGWYDLAVVSLRAGDCNAAISHLDEVLTLIPGDPDATKLRELAARYSEQEKDRSYFDEVEALDFRPLPQ